MAGINAMTKNWSQGVDIKEMLSGAAGLAITTVVPGMVVKTTTTMGSKLMKLGVSLAVTALGAYALKSVAGAQAGKAAFIGGVAGTTIQALTMFNVIKLGSPIRRLGETVNIGPGVTREQEEIQLIRP